MNSKVYKWCAVPQCQNTSISSPNKVFVHVPNKKTVRDKWFILARRNPNEVVSNSPIYFCEDHFDLPNDMENYMEYHLMGSVSQVRMKPGCMPKKFSCQPDRETQPDTTELPFIAKKRKVRIPDESKKNEKNTVTEQEIASDSSVHQIAKEYSHLYIPILPRVSDKSVEVHTSKTVIKKPIQRKISAIHQKPSSLQQLLHSESTSPVKMKPDANNVSNVTELDKFKRRMIRSLAWALIHEKKPEEEVWEKMKKETGFGCHMLWQRMRILTLKKLKRLYAADDNFDNVPTVARMTQTDWLLFDLVVVHEDIDLIDKENMIAPHEDRAPLIALFDLVNKHDIENLSGDRLAESWTAAAFEYNTNGRQCSPMLLQKRWYQIKEVTRHLFYKFWFVYRGNARHLLKAEENKPTQLLREVARKYPKVITTPFLEWQELIDRRLVILSDEFETRKCMEAPKTPAITTPVTSVVTEIAPDIEVIEPVIETIELDMDSDSEKEKIKDNTQTDNIIQITNIKQETTDPEDEIENAKDKFPLALQSVETESKLLDNDDEHTTEVDNEDSPFEDNSNDDDIIESPGEDYLEIEIDSSLSTDRTEKSGMKPNEEENDLSIPKITHVYGNVDLSSQILNLHHGEEFPVSKDCNEPQNEMIEESVAEDVLKNTEIDEQKPKNSDKSPEVTVIDSGDESDDKKQKDLADTNTNIKDESDVSDKDRGIETIDVSNVNEKDETEDIVMKFEIDDTPNYDFIENGIEFVDDGIEYIEEDHNSTVKSTEAKKEENEENHSSTNEGEDSTTKFDLKLLMNPVVYTTRVDEMNIIKKQSYEYINGADLLQSIILESKPISKLTVDMNEIKIDNDDLDLNDAGSESDTSIDDTMKVKMTSYLLQKPRNRSYNPIQLCKNPDFNTRLKRLTVGFLSSSRNRGLLKACKPMTVDVMKAFETRLVNGTLYLKDCEHPPVVTIDDEDRKTVSIVPSTMSIQSLLDNPLEKPEFVLPKQETASHKVDDAIERNKIINLPDISEVRRINQRLLTAEVPPLRVQTNTKTVLNTEIKREIDIEISPAPAPCENTANKPGNTFSDVIVQIPTETVTITDTPNDPPLPISPIKRQGRPIQPKKKPKPVTTEKVSTSTKWRPMLKSRSGWLKKIVEPKCDSLLTCDTLSKMLLIMCGKDNSSSKSKFKTIEIHSDLARDIAARKEPWKPKYCCWARYDMITSREKKWVYRKFRHRCEGPCVCCCKDFKTSAEKLTNPTPNNEPLSQTPVPAKKIITRILSGNMMSNIYDKHPEQKEAIDNSVLGHKSDIRIHNLSENANNMAVSDHLNSVNCVSEASNAVQVVNEDLNRVKVMEDDLNRVQLVNDDLISVEAVSDVLNPVQVVSDNSKPTQVLNENLNTVQVVSDDLSPVQIVNDDLNPVYDVSEDSNPAQDLKEENKQGSTIAHNLNDNTDLNSAGPIVVQDVSYDSENEEVVAKSPQKEQISTLKPDQTNPRPPMIKVRRFSNHNISSDNHKNVVSMSILKRNVEHQNLTPIPPEQPIKCYTDDYKLKQTRPNLKTLTIEPLGLKAPRGPMLIQRRNPQPNILRQRSPKQPFYIVQDRDKNTGRPGPYTLKLQTNKEMQNKTKVHTNRVTKVVNSQMLSKKTSGSPIMLDPSTILVTNVRIPLKSKKSDPTENPANQVPGLPDGVQIVLLPNGELKMTAKPGVVIDAQQAASIPIIMETIQKQLIESGIIPASCITVKNSLHIDNTINYFPNDILKPTEDVLTAINEAHEKPAEHVGIVSNDVETEPVTENTSEVPQTDKQEENPVVAQNIEVPDSHANINDSVRTDNSTENTKPSDSENTNQPNDVSPQQPATDKRSLLSDLMMMSGISEEDTVPVPEPTPEPVPDITATDKLTETYPLPTIQEAALPKLIPIIPESATFITDPSKYCPVSSYDDLKYVLELKGSFFARNLLTGGISPINVKLGKLADKAKGTPITKEVIDLTDDVDQKEETPPPKRLYNSKLNAIELYNNLIKNKMKPFTLDKPVVKSRRSVLKNLLVTDGQEVDLIDSDGSMDEEYLDESGNEASVATDSSDDEPLIKKVKRNLQQSDVTPDAGGKDPESEAVSAPIDEQVVEPMVTETETNASQNEQIVEPIEIIKFPDGPTDSSGENCILGV